MDFARCCFPGHQSRHPCRPSIFVFLPPLSWVEVWSQLQIRVERHLQQRRRSLGRIVFGLSKVKHVGKLVVLMGRSASVRLVMELRP